jgi:hypothetical protein
MNKITTEIQLLNISTSNNIIEVFVILVIT